MSVQSIQNSIEQTQRDISSLHQKLTNESKNEASKAERVLQIKQSIPRTSSPSTVQS